MRHRMQVLILRNGVRYKVKCLHSYLDVLQGNDGKCCQDLTIHSVWQCFSKHLLMTHYILTNASQVAMPLAQTF